MLVLRSRSGIWGDRERAWTRDKEVLARSLCRHPWTSKKPCFAFAVPLGAERKIVCCRENESPVIINNGRRGQAWSGGPLASPPSPPWENWGRREKGAKPGAPSGCGACQTGPNLECFRTYSVLSGHWGGPSSLTPRVE